MVFKSNGELPVVRGVFQTIDSKNCPALQNTSYLIFSENSRLEERTLKKEEGAGASS